MVFWVKRGELGAFDRQMRDEKLMHLLLRHDLFLLLEKISGFVMQRLVKRVYTLSGLSTRLSFSSIQSAFQLSLEEGVDLAQIECWLCVLISQGLLKGYLAHDQAMLVLSKQQPFPAISQVTTTT
jgi:hypothetical protein